MARVTLDIFSGRPNPTWEVDESDLQDLLGEVGSARDLVGGVDSGSGKLGFRGLIVEAEGAGGDLPGVFRVSGDDPRGVELADSILARLGPPTGVVGGDDQDLPFGLARLEDLDLRRLIREGAGAGARPRGADASGDDASSGTLSAEEGTAQADTAVIQALNPAPVLGTDASSHSTITVGSCSIEVAAFNPTFWNNATYQSKNNCYNYATNRRTDTFAQPGRAAGAQATSMRCANVTNGALADGAHQAPNCVSAEPPRWYMALVIWPNVDYHWYRRQAEGYWGHKPGQTAARNTDNSGVVITNPETANRGNYRDFCGYFFARSGMGIR